MKTKLILFIIACFCAGINAQTKVYTLKINPSVAVQPYTTIDGLNFYILQEQAGDKCITCLSMEKALRDRSIALEAISPNVEKINTLMVEQNSSLHKENEILVEKINQKDTIIKQEKKINKDLEKKNNYYQKELRSQKRNKWAGVVLAGVAGFAAGIVINSFSSN